MEMDSLFSFIALTTLLALSPGPDNLYVLMQSALHGRMAGIWVTLGLCTGLIVHTTAVSLGIAVLFQTSLLAFTLLKFIGVGYLFYLAWQAFKAASIHLTSGTAKALSPGQLYRRGVLMNLTNPKVSIFFLAFLPQFINTSHGQITQQTWALGLSVILITLLVFGGIALLAGLVKQVNDSPKIQRRLHQTTAFVLAGLAIKLAVTER
ncbi:MAG: LysE family translocator [Hydrogenovibrio sp.]|nr:LysE family translocator [Hydrogenovibrio sp.]